MGQAGDNVKLAGTGETNSVAFLSGSRKLVGFSSADFVEPKDEGVDGCVDSSDLELKAGLFAVVPCCQGWHESPSPWRLSSADAKRSFAPSDLVQDHEYSRFTVMPTDSTNAETISTISGSVQMRPEP